MWFALLVLRNDLRLMAEAARVRVLLPAAAPPNPAALAAHPATRPPRRTSASPVPGRRDTSQLTMSHTSAGRGRCQTDTQFDTA